MIYRTSIEPRPNLYDIQKAFIDGYLDLYRRSLGAGEEGDCYIFHEFSPESNQNVIGFLRTTENIPVAVLKTLGVNVRKLTDDQVLELFKAAFNATP